MSELEHPERVVANLRDAGDALSAAHHSAGEREDDRTDLNGAARDIIFGLNTAVEGLIEMIEDRQADPVVTELRDAVRSIAVYALHHNCEFSSEALLHQRAQRVLDLIERGRDETHEQIAT